MLWLCKLSSVSTFDCGQLQNIEVNKGLIVLMGVQNMFIKCYLHLVCYIISVNCKTYILKTNQKA